MQSPFRSEARLRRRHLTSVGKLFLGLMFLFYVASVTLRSVHRQEPPYRPLAEVAESQSVWTHEDVGGTLVGVRCPSWVG